MGTQLRRFVVTLCIFFLSFMVGVRLLPWLYAAYRLPVATPNEVGLQWRECRLSEKDYQDTPNYQLVESCFGHPLLGWSDAEQAAFARVVDGHQQLIINGDTYTKFSQWHGRWSLLFGPTFTLRKNGQVIKSFRGHGQGYTPDLLLQNVGGKATWEFVDRWTTTVIYDGVDLRRLYGLHKAYRAYAIAAKLIVIGQRFNQFFVIYAGQRVGPMFDAVWNAYCCEGGLYAVTFGQGAYLFRGQRDDNYYLVEITAAR